MAGILFWLCIFGIFYVYAGYPLLLALLSRVISRPPVAGPGLPSVTLLIAAYNEEAVIAEKIENSLHLDYPADKLQVLVAADGSDDRTVEVVHSFAARGVELSFDPARLGKMSAINRAMQAARYEIILFSDANNLYPPDTLRELVRFFSDPLVGAVSGSKHVLNGDGSLGDSEGMYWKYESFIKKQETRLGSCTGVAGEIFAIRRDLFVMPPARIINDDFFIAMQVIRQGRRVVYAPQAASMERVSQSAQEEIVRRTRIVAGRYQAMSMSLGLLPFRQPLVVWQVISHKFMRPLVPFFMLGALIANGLALAFSSRAEASLLRLSGVYGQLVFGFQVLFYLLAWIGGRMKSRGLLSKLMYVPTFLVNSNFAALLGLFKYATGRQSVVWQRAARRSESNGNPI
jgi:cellulose synthase/poly-beta-1,6-N-acetylglucosamine synthase-like glycosyltransferase